MGEKDLSNKISFPPDSEQVALFWNLEDYPITTSTADLKSFYANLVLALRKMNFDGPSVLFLMFGDKFELFKSDPVENVPIYYVPTKCDKNSRGLREVGENAADFNMALEIVTMAAAKPGLNIMVLSKQKPKSEVYTESEVYRVLRVLKSRKFNVLVLQDLPADSTAENLFRSVDSIVASTQVFEGLRPPVLY